MFRRVVSTVGARRRHEGVRTPGAKFVWAHHLRRDSQRVRSVTALGFMAEYSRQRKEGESEDLAIGACFAWSGKSETDQNGWVMGLEGKSVLRWHVSEAVWCRGRRTPDESACIWMYGKFGPDDGRDGGGMDIEVKRLEVGTRVWRSQKRNVHPLGSLLPLSEYITPSQPFSYPSPVPSIPLASRLPLPQTCLPSSATPLASGNSTCIGPSFLSVVYGIQKGEALTSGNASVLMILRRALSHQTASTGATSPADDVHAF
ncbi:hypothetical protein EW146_g8969 [Bondarzewia mesenterica]|uniref:Uncharacterized protein n=1 Tax=Bondarzewia mesenterica TaxID=1095465 RepID=A0A4S4LAG6_9AGAM|nr:hypothetical protein EW146_g8969 [Bondarzewia mesenterica]